ncbi:Synaptotagmin-like protein 2 [Basidiobolus ranarum]|uniref:Synaptotagmin-like protein 2 n=1 Tax=Basidiobolus ranarum TaxID=34480 RepID=A0ABR2VPM6_9FUNG
MFSLKPNVRLVALARTTPLLSSINSHLVNGKVPQLLLTHEQRSFYSSPGGYGNSAWSRKRVPRNTIVKFVPQQEAWVVERMGKFNRVLEPGLAILVPFLDSIKYVKSLKEVAVEIPTQSAITQDNVTLQLDGVLYYKVEDPYKASYGVEDSEFSVAQLAQTTMRAEIGQMTLDKTLAERNMLNINIVEAINTAAADWGIRCLRYEIRDIHPPDNVVEAMHSQVSAERSKRAQILESEGARQSAINVAEGKKQATILASEAQKLEQINEAQGEAEAIILRAQATAQGIQRIAQSITQSRGGHHAVSLTVAEKYVDAFGKLAKEGTTIVVPAAAADVGSMVAQALTIYNKINHTVGNQPSSNGSEEPSGNPTSEKQSPSQPQVSTITDEFNVFQNNLDDFHDKDKH